MEDFEIVDLYWARSESAIRESDRKYGRMLRSVSLSLTSSREDAEECVNDTYLDAWNAMPTQRPAYLGAFLAKITRSISIDRFRAAHREKRGGNGTPVEELTECIPDSADLFADYENGRLSALLNRFVASLDAEKRAMFLQRYFYSRSVAEIAVDLGVGESKVKVTLMRLRNSLRDQLEKEDLPL